MSNRTLAEMRSRVRRLAHDLYTAETERTYENEDVDWALEDALNELSDRLLADDLGRWSLLTVGEETEIATTEAAAAVELPADCLRLERVEWFDDDVDDEDEWRVLPQLSQPPPPADVMALSRQTSVEVGYRTVAGSAGRAVGWRVNEPGDSIRLYPWDSVDSMTIRLVYLAEPVWAGTATSRLGLPVGADEIVELMAADKLTADEPRDEKRMVMYRARLDGRYQRWVMGRARGKVDRGQRIAGEA
jgi:hypothetical protein